MKTTKLMAVLMAVVMSMTMASCSEDEVNTEVVNGSQEALNAACAQWKLARADWENTEAFLFGAADEYSIDPHTDTWPVDQVALANILRDNSIMADINNKVRTMNSSVLGYHGIEYVLFREGQPRQVSQITALEYNYVCAVARDLYQATCVLETTWSGATSGDRYNETIDYLRTRSSLDDEGDVTGESLAYFNFGKDFKTTGGTYDTSLDATIQIVEGARDIISEVGGSKIGLPYTGEDKSYIESPYAYNSIIDFYDNIVSCQNALYGAMGATSPNEKSLIYFCLNSSNETLKSAAKDVQTKLNVALSAIHSMKAPFALYYTDSSCKAAIDALGELDSTLDVLTQHLEAYRDNQTVQNQCQVINENYVDAVVVPTYRSLCSNAYTLYQYILKIKG